MFDEKSYADGNYKVEDAILTKVKYKGKGPDEGTVSLKQGKVVRGEFCYQGYSITYENNKATYEKAKNYCQKNYNYEIILNADGYTIQETLNEALLYISHETTFN